VVGAGYVGLVAPRLAGAAFASQPTVHAATSVAAIHPHPLCVGVPYPC
jgi:hypothetical protein